MTAPSARKRIGRGRRVFFGLVYGPGKHGGNAGSPTNYAFMNPILSELPNGIWVTKTAPRFHAAALLMDFLLSKETQQFFAQRGRRMAHREVAYLPNPPPHYRWSVPNPAKDRAIMTLSSRIGRFFSQSNVGRLRRNQNRNRHFTTKVAKSTKQEIEMDNQVDTDVSGSVLASHGCRLSMPA
jgi:hypothetical protein